MAQNWLDQASTPVTPSEQKASADTSWLDKGSTLVNDDKSKGRSAADYARDAAAWTVKGAIAVPEAAVGLADLATGGRVGKFLENEGGTVGFRPKPAREAVNEWHSDATKEAQRKFQEAEGLGGKFKAAVENPSNIVGAVVESLPAMGAGGVAARALGAATRLGQAGAKGAAAAGALGEGVVGAGSAAEQIRQETDDGLLSPGQVAAAAATGAATAGFGYAGGRVAQRLGIGDAETMLAQGNKGIAKQFADDAATAATNPLLQQRAVKSIPRQVIEGAISEGFSRSCPSRWQSRSSRTWRWVKTGPRTWIRRWCWARCRARPWAAARRGIVRRASHVRARPRPARQLMRRARRISRPLRTLQVLRMLLLLQHLAQLASRMPLYRILGWMPCAANSMPACRSCSRKRAASQRCRRPLHPMARQPWRSSARQNRTGAMRRTRPIARSNPQTTRSCNPRARRLSRPRAPWGWIRKQAPCLQLPPLQWTPAQQRRPSRPVPWPRPQSRLHVHQPRRRHPSAR